MTLHFREMRPTDLASVTGIEAATFPSPWTNGVFTDELSAPNRAWIVADDDGELLGYGGVMVIDDDAHVMNLAVRDDARGHGIGRSLLRILLDCATDMGAQRATLEVRESNLGAISLYQSEGLHAVGVRPGYYADTSEDAVIMWGDLRQRALVAPEPIHIRNVGAEVILAIETSCDETAAAVMRGGRELLSNVVASQIDFHARFGGVVPEIASRKHAEAIVGVVDEALEHAEMTLADIDALAVTHGPGLVGALVVGLAYAKGLAFATGLPLVGVNHLEGHIFAAVLSDPAVRPPLVALVVSGGHTSLVHMPEWGVYETMGETLDDAAGEAFDKVAKVLGLGYPGGPVISKLAEQGDPAAIDFPRAMLHSGDYRFSLSGLKTAVINYIRHEHEAGREIDAPNLAASFQQAVIDVQVAKALRAVEETAVGRFVLAGGVAANRALRDALTVAMEARGVAVTVPPVSLCTDNAAMIAAAAHFRYVRGDVLDLAAEADPALRLDTPPARA
jgi:N6-L-threonylcarbamoyladenine synthase/protein kinase Bud32